MHYVYLLESTAVPVHHRAGPNRLAPSNPVKREAGAGGRARRRSGSIFGAKADAFEMGDFGLWNWRLPANCRQTDRYCGKWCGSGWQGRFRLFRPWFDKPL